MTVNRETIKGLIKCWNEMSNASHYRNEIRAYALAAGQTVEDYIESVFAVAPAQQQSNGNGVSAKKQDPFWMSDTDLRTADWDFAKAVR